MKHAIAVDRPTTIHRYLDEAIHQLHDPELLEAKRKRLAQDRSISSPFLLVLADALISTSPEWIFAQEPGDCYIVQSLFGNTASRDLITQIELGAHAIETRNLVLLAGVSATQSRDLRCANQGMVWPHPSPAQFPTFCPLRSQWNLTSSTIITAHEPSRLRGCPCWCTRELPSP